MADVELKSSFFAKAEVFRTSAARAALGNPLTRPPMVVPGAWTTGQAVRQGEVRSFNALWWVALSTGTAGATAPALNTSNPVVSDGTVLWSCIGAPTLAADDPMAPTVTFVTSAPAGLTNFWSPVSFSDCFSARGGYPTTLATTGWRVYTCNWAAASPVGRFPSVVMRVDAPKFAIKLGSNRKGVRIIIDGRYYSVSSYSFASDTWMVMDFTAVGGRTPRTIEVESGQDHMDFLGLYTTSQDQPLAPPASNLRLGFLADSILAGSAYGPFRGGGDIGRLMSKSLGWDDPWNFSIGGTGDIATGGSYYTYGQRIPEILTRSVDGLIYMGSTNDRGQSAADIKAARKASLTAFRAGSAAPIVVFGVLPVSDAALPAGSKNLDVENAIRDAVSEIGDPLTYFIPMTAASPIPPITGTWNNSANPSSVNAPAYINQSDLVHPVDIGTAYIADWMATKFRSDVLPNL